MRKMKFIKAQDHLLVFLEIDNRQGEANCNAGHFPATDCTAFIGTGSTENYLRTESKEWAKCPDWSALDQNEISPRFLLIHGEPIACITTSDLVQYVALQPLTRPVLEAWQPLFGMTDEDIETLLSTDNRESFIEVRDEHSDGVFDLDTCENTGTSLLDDSEITIL
tara:strand:- start:29 stop:526 length:498 start_codon:yes stop_codon:yes gene_type:complete